ncbi:pilus assembly protein CpaE [Novosphingobium sp. Gsoil 351]|uniref:AAA family ATPase n=1 Tax=Novosphingobium sp. Gsoil 351 TaxID=2675225 RepID=UPI0012B464D3|nr:pilus assembly protein CpaE [Novosphingobium sp. Gsoil 351]QGN54465.1 pilus assembly protein CpaE [Novosphingobium sp. Gsoil 351]
MGTLDTPFDLGGGMAIGMPSDVFVVANGVEIDRLRAGVAFRRLADLRLIAASPAEPLPEDVIASAALLVIEVDPADRASMRRIAQVRSARPNLPLVVALHDANVATVRTLVRQGVNDVAAIPFDLDELTAQLLDLAAQMREKQVAHVPLAPLVSVVRSAGGAGATTVITHLAAALAANDPPARGVCLIDLDIQYGSIGAALGKSAKTTALELLEAGNRLDAEFLRAAVVASGRQFDLIVAPDAITPLEAIDVDQLLHMLTIARREYGAVLVDLPANWTNWALSTALASTEILLVTDLTIPGLRQTKRRLELFDTVGIARERVRLIVNRVEKRLFRMIGLDEVRRTLGHPVHATLAGEPTLLATSQDQGLLAWEANRKSKFGQDIVALAAGLTREWGG